MLRNLSVLSLLLISAVVVALLLGGCQLLGIKGNVTLSLTDAPVDADNVTGVYISITGIEYNTATGGWQTVPDFVPPEDPINLLDLTGGVTAVIGENMSFAAGQYNQIRFLLDIAEQSQGAPTNPGCYMTFADLDGDGEDEVEPLFVPSGEKSGYKAVGTFTVPIGGTVEITADFDVRKAVVEAGPRYILKPTIRLIVDNQAGWINGSVDTGVYDTDTECVVVYAYADDTWTDSETDEPAAGSEETTFPNAVTSARVCTDGDYSYKLAFLEAGTYDLVVVTTATDGTQTVLGFISDVEVSSESGTTQEVSADTITSP